MDRNFTNWKRGGRMHCEAAFPSAMQIYRKVFNRQL